jgi:hypothetical protein
MHLGDGTLIRVIHVAQKQCCEDVLLGDLPLGPQLKDDALEAASERRGYPAEDTDQGLSREVGCR